MSIKDTPIKPTCRYGHGDLFEVHAPEEERKSDVSEFGFVQRNGLGALFVGKLFVCSTCGYTEFFDTDPRATLQQTLESRRGNN